MSEKTPQATRPHFILIVDKNLNSAAMIKSMFEAWGYFVEIVQTPKEVFDILRTKDLTKPDLILVEIINQDSDIFTLPMGIQQIPEGAHVPIVAHSVMSERATVINAINCGYRDYIIRPTDPDLLREKIRSLLTDSTQINGATYAFPTTDIGNVSIEVKVAAISEFGIEAWSDHFFENGSILKIDSPLMKQLLLSDAPLRVTGCEHMNHQERKYKIGLTFVALKEPMARAIRQHIIRNSNTTKRYAA